MSRKANAGLRLVTPESIMRSRAFKQGFIDVRCDFGFRKDYEHMHPSHQWDYEQGRMVALLAPNFVLGKTVSKEALEVFEAVSGLIP